MKHIKVIIQDGIVQDILANFDGDYSFEVVDIDPDFEDCDSLTAYADSLYEDKNYHQMRFTHAHFDFMNETAELSEAEPSETYTV